MQLDGKTILVTGCGGGIGSETCRLVVARGGSLVAADLDSAGASVAEECGAEYLSLDVTSESAWTAARKRVEERFGALHGLVNNAGVILMKPLLETSLVEYRRLNAINAEGTFLGMRALAPLLAESAGEHGASIVNLSSIYGLGGQPGFSAYGASKGAVRLLGQAAALEFAQNGMNVRVNSVHPGPINTPLVRGPLEAAVAAGALPSTQAGIDLVAAGYPHGRMGVASDVAGVIVFLLSDDARFVNGAELPIDDGLSAKAQ
ncbi:MAG: SDR family oxidoreductase [bacterium]|nr:SDR family oxidoreductase [bacterium]